jgi:protein-disulfide isomerase
MRCEEAENYIAEYLAGTLPAQSAFLDHLKFCSRCQSEVEDFRRMWVELGDFSVPKAASAMQPRLVAALAAAREPIPQNPTGRKPMPYMIKPILVIVVAVGAAFYAGHSLVQPTLEPVIATVPAVNGNTAHYRGDSNAPLTLVEYGDYQCPPCAGFNVVINEVLRRYADKVRLEFRHYPLAPLHANAMQAAIAVEAAGEQGHYWEMHDALLESQQQWARAANPQSAFADIAARIGLDQKKFLQSLQAPEEFQQRITNDITGGRGIHVEATPTFFLNGRQLEQIQPTVEYFAAAIDEELKRAK